MTKKVISILVLIVASFIAAIGVSADYVGLPGKVFDLTFYKYVENFFEISFTDAKDNACTSMSVNTSYELRDAQCKVVVTANSQNEIRVIFNLFHNVDENVSDTISYTAMLKGTDGATPITGYEALKVDADNTTSSTNEGYFTAGTKSGSVVVSKYPIGFKFEDSDFDNAAPGDYKATIVVEVKSST